MFKATSYNKDTECIDNKYVFNRFEEVEVDKDKWLPVDRLKVGGKLFTSDGTYDIIKNIKRVDTNIEIEV